MCLMPVSAALAKTFHFDYQKNIDISGDLELSIQNSSGLIEIEGGAEGQISINATKNVKATDQEEAEEVADHIEIRVDRKGSKISIETRYLKLKKSQGSFLEKLFGSGTDSFGSVDYKLIVPSNCGISIDNMSGDIKISKLDKNARVLTSSGNINISFLNGTLDLETASGKIELSDIVGDVDIAGTSCDLLFGSIKGAVDIRTTSGQVIGKYVTGSVRVSHTSGTTDISKLYGDLKIKSQTGDITIQQDSGSVEVQSSTGDVEIMTELNSLNDYFVETKSGRITLMVPETSAGSVKLETTSGHINTELPLSIREFTKSKLIGDFGEHGPGIYLMTISGDITLGHF